MPLLYALLTLLLIRCATAFHVKMLPRLPLRPRSLPLPSEILSGGAARASSRDCEMNPTPAGADWWKRFADEDEDEDEGNSFREHRPATEFATSLLAAVPVNHNQELGLQLIKLNNTFPEVSSTKNIFSRKHSREVLGVLLHRMRLHEPPILTLNKQPSIDVLVNPAHWTKEQTDLAEEDVGNRHAVIEGASGIGKSFSLFWLLRVLLQRGEHVVFHSMRTNSVYQFVPPRENDGFSAEEHLDEGGRPRYRVFRCLQDDFRPWKCAALYNPQAFYLFDPAMNAGEAEKVNAHTVTASPPNSVHYIQRNSETDDWYFMSPWTLPEVIAAAPVVAEDGMARELREELAIADEEELKKALEEEVRKAFYVCGGSLRNIFARELIDVKQDQNATIGDYVAEEPKGLHNVEAIFGREGRIDGETDPDKSSRLFAYLSEFPFMRKQKQRTIVSGRVSHELALAFKDVIMISIGMQMSKNNNDEAGKQFERVALAQLARGGEFSTRLAPVKTLRKNMAAAGNFTTMNLKAVDAKDLNRVREHGEKLATLCAALPSVEEQRANQSLPRFLYTSDNPMFEFVDCVDAKDRGYQITVSKEHDLNPEDACDFLKEVGATKEKPFHLYLVVPSFIEGLDKLSQSIRGITEFKKQYPEKYKFLEESLVHHVLVIDKIVQSKPPKRSGKSCSSNEHSTSQESQTKQVNKLTKL